MNESAPQGEPVDCDYCEGTGRDPDFPTKSSCPVCFGKGHRAAPLAAPLVATQAVASMRPLLENWQGVTRPPQGQSAALPSDEREAFEAWHKLPENNAWREQSAWHGWQARSRLPLPAPAGVEGGEKQDSGHPAVHGAWHFVLYEFLHDGPQWVPAQKNENHWNSARFSGIPDYQVQVGPAIVHPAVNDSPSALRAAPRSQPCALDRPELPVRLSDVALQVHKMDLRVGDTIEGREEAGDYWHEARLTLLWVGQCEAMWMETTRSSERAEWSEPEECGNWTLDCRKWKRIDRAALSAQGNGGTA